MKDRHTKGNRKRKLIHPSGGTFCVNCVFERQINGLYTEEALLYQNILEYFDEDTGKIETTEGRQALQIRCRGSQTLGYRRVNTWSLTKWLLAKNLGLREYYSSGDKRYMTDDTKIRHRLQTIQKRVNDLAECRLLKKMDVECAKNGQPTPIYTITDDGIILLWLMKYNIGQLELSDKDKMERILFQLIQAYYSRSQSYIGDFTSRLYERFMQKGFSSHMLRHLLRTLHSNKHLVNSLNEVLDFILQDSLMRLQTRKIFLNIYFEVLNGFSEDEKKIILHHQKADVESRIHLARPPKDWEECWIEYINDYSKLVLYGKCTNCFQAYPVLMDYVDYRTSFLHEDSIPKMNCNKCTSHDALEVYNDIRRLIS
jgi:hypothetical protein